MLADWMLRQDKKVPRRLLVAIATLLVVTMTSGLILFGFNLFLRFIWEQFSSTHQYYNTTLANKSRIEFSLSRMRRLADPPLQTPPPPETLVRQIKDVLEHAQPGSIVTLDFSPFARPVSVLINRPLEAPQSDDVSMLMARAAVFDRWYWGLNDALGGRTDLMLADNSAGLIVPAIPARFQPDHEGVLQLFQFWREMNERYQTRINQIGSETVWSKVYSDRFSNEQVISYAAGAKDKDGHLKAILTYTVPGEQLLGNADDRQEQSAVQSGQMVLFDYTGRNILYQGKNIHGYDLNGLGERFVSKLDQAQSGTVFWFEQSSLMFGGRSDETGWRSLYIAPLSVALQEFRWQLAVGISCYFFGLFLIYYGVRQVRYRVLIPLQHSAEQIEQSEHFNRTIIQIAPVGLRVVRLADGCLEIENELARKILPFSTQYKGHSWVKSLPADGPGRLQLQVDGGNGKKIDIQIVSEPVRHFENEVLLCAISDMTEEFQIRRTLQDAREVADQANQMKSLFLAAMSHEIRTPLYGVIGTLELLSLGELNPFQRQQLDTIQFSSRVLLQVLNDLLDYSKVEAGQLDLEHISFDPIDLVETAVQAQWPIAQRKSLRLACYLQPDLPWMTGDPVRIRQILDNLLSNALKFTSQGEVSVRMWQTSHEHDLQKINVHIEVADTGIGIAPEVQKRLFEPFYQGERAMGRRFGGTGLGLSICREFVKLMHGTISLSSKPGEGSRFFVTIELGRGDSRTWRPVKFPPVVVLSDDAQWQRHLMELITQAGGQATAWTTDRPEADKVLLVAAARTMVTPKVFRKVVRLQADGPLQPERHWDGYVVNAYSQGSILHALCLAGGLQPDAVITMSHGGLNIPQLGLKVLVVEDHPYNRQLLQQQLEQLGCHVQVAGNGVEALSVVEQDTFDVVLTDVQMPVMDGYELTKHLRAQGSPLPIIGLTASITQEEGQRCLDAGMVSLLSKPILLAVLAQGLQAALPQRIMQLQQAASLAALAPALQADTQGLLIQTLKEDSKQLFAAFERGDLGRIKQLAHRIRGATIHADGGEEVATLCGELEQNMNATLSDLRQRIDDLALYISTMCDQLSS